MSFITSILKELLQKEVRNPVGRWSMESCVKKRFAKVDLANEDHCGTCKEYTLSQIKTIEAMHKQHKHL